MELCSRGSLRFRPEGMELNRFREERCPPHFQTAHLSLVCAIPARGCESAEQWNVMCGYPNARWLLINSPPPSKVLGSAREIGLSTSRITSGG